MSRTACAEPQCLYKGAFYLYLTLAKRRQTFRYRLSTVCADIMRGAGTGPVVRPLTGAAECKGRLEGGRKIVLN